MTLFSESNAPTITSLVMSRVKGLKHDAGKPMWGLLPWAELNEVVKVLTLGADKYGRGNWKLVKGGEDRYFNACLRHLAALRVGERSDPETGLNHYSHAICSLLFAFWHNRRIQK